MLFLVAAGIAAAANARILRVNNVESSSAPYRTFADAHDAANAGDTIMIDGSPFSYGSNNVTKQLVILGPGYWLTSNHIIEEGADCAYFKTLTLQAEGIVIKGITIESGSHITIMANKCIVNRCRSGNNVLLRNASNSIIHQNIINGVEGYGSSYVESNIQVTNNICKGRISNLVNSYIAHNTVNGNVLFACKNCTVEHNMGSKELSGGTGNSISDNYVTDSYTKLFGSSSSEITDKNYYDVELENGIRETYGAFSGDSPYVLSGIPAGPVIQDLVVPTTVEMGSKLNVTIKVGVQQ